MRKISMLVWHCTATPEGREFSVAAIDKMHRDRGFAKIGYHKLVHLDGSVSEGRPESEIGAHVAGHNTGTIGYAYVGGVERDGKTPEDTRTPEQKAAMLRLTREAIARYHLTAVVGHRDLSPDKDGDGIVEPSEWVKVCPCFDVGPEYGYLLGTLVIGPPVKPPPAGSAVAEGEPIPFPSAAEHRGLIEDEIEVPSEANLRLIQRALQDRGYHEVGMVDGKWGDRTHDALNAMRRRNGLRPLLEPGVTWADRQVLLDGRPRSVSPERATGMPPDSEIVSSATKATTVGATAGIAGTALAGVQALQGGAESAGGIASSLRPVMEVVGDWWPVLLIVIGVAVAWWALRIRRREIAAFRSGEST